MNGPRDGHSRRRAHRFGLSAEWVAAMWLMAKGYRLIDRRFTIRGGELDLVMWRRDTVAFVEVKARERMDDALTSIDETKRRRIGKAARVWLARNPWAAQHTLRGDAVFLAPWRLPRHMVEAYTLDLD